MEVKWFFIAIACVAFSASISVSFNSYNATKAGLEECQGRGDNRAARRNRRQGNRLVPVQRRGASLTQCPKRERYYVC